MPTKTELKPTTRKEREWHMSAAEKGGGFDPGFTLRLIADVERLEKECRALITYAKDRGIVVEDPYADKD